MIGFNVLNKALDYTKTLFSNIKLHIYLFIILKIYNCLYIKVVIPTLSSNKFGTVVNNGFFYRLFAKFDILGTHSRLLSMATECTLYIVCNP